MENKLLSFAFLRERSMCIGNVRCMDSELFPMVLYVTEIDIIFVSWKNKVVMPATTSQFHINFKFWGQVFNFMVSWRWAVLIVYWFLLCFYIS